MGLIYKIFNTNLADYTNLGVTGDFYINHLLLGLFLGICIAAYVVSFYRKYMNTITRQLVRHGANSPECAKTLMELRLGGSMIVKWMLSHSGQLKKVVARLGEATLTYDEYVELSKSKRLPSEKIDFATEKFYIREEMKDRAAHIVDNYRTSWINTTLFCVLLFVVFGTLMILMPDILTAINGALVP